jgi:hypothetical protein
LQKKTLFVGHDRRDDINHLRQVGHLDDIRVAEKRIEKHAHRERVFKVVNLFQLFAIAGAIPDIPFVVGDIDGPWIRSGADLPDEAFSYIDVIVDRL